MKCTRLLLILFFVVMMQRAAAQKKVVLDSVHFATAINYLGDTANQKLLFGFLNTALKKYHFGELSDTTQTQFINLGTRTFASALPSLNMTVYDTNIVKLSLVVAEYQPLVFFSGSKNDTEDSLLQKDARTVFRVYLRLIKQNNEVVHDGILDIIVKRSRSRGIGNESPFVFLMPKSFIEVMKTALGYMLNPEGTAERIAVSVSPLFMEDNYIYPKVMHQPRILADTAKDISAFLYKDQRQMLRLAEPLYEQLVLKGKKAGKYSWQVMAAIDNAPNASYSDFIFLRQEARDVVQNKNYQLVLLSQIDPEVPARTPQLLFTNFMTGDLHVLLNENDTIARFNISKFSEDMAKNIFPGRIYNGVDSNSMMRIADTKIRWNATYNYVAHGKLGNLAFEITCGSLNNMLKEIYVNDQLVCIGQGRFAPEVLVVLDNSLSPEILNQLLVIAFNRFFE